MDYARFNGGHCAALTQQGQVVVWGRGSEGQLGNGTWDAFSAPAFAYVPGTYRPSFPFDRFWTSTHYHYLFNA